MALCAAPSSTRKAGTRASAGAGEAGIPGATPCAIGARHGTGRGPGSQRRQRREFQLRIASTLTLVPGRRLASTSPRATLPHAPPSV
eukprot:6631763-Alexandrium_andersonii.AAC.2